MYSRRNPLSGRSSASFDHAGRRPELAIENVSVSLRM